MSCFVTGVYAKVVGSLTIYKCTALRAVRYTVTKNRETCTYGNKAQCNVRILHGTAHGKSQKYITRRAKYFYRFVPRPTVLLVALNGKPHRPSHNLS